MWEVALRSEVDGRIGCGAGFNSKEGEGRPAVGSPAGAQSDRIRDGACVDRIHGIQHHQTSPGMVRCSVGKKTRSSPSVAHGGEEESREGVVDGVAQDGCSGAWLATPLVYLLAEHDNPGRLPVPGLAGCGCCHRAMRRPRASCVGPCVWNSSSQLPAGHRVPCIMSEVVPQLITASQASCRT